MNSLLNPGLDKTYDYNTKKYKRNCTVLKCGNCSSTMIPPDTPSGSTFTIASITVCSLNSPIIEFQCNILNNLFIGALSFQVFKSCVSDLTLIPIGPSWTFSSSSVNNEANIFSFLVCDNDICTNKCCTYTVVATVQGTPGLAITGVGLGGVMTFHVEGNENILAFFINGIIIPFSGAELTAIMGNIKGVVTIKNLLSNYSVIQNGNTITITNVGVGATAYNLDNGIFKGIGYISSDDANNTSGTITVDRVDGTVTENNSTGGNLSINNATLSVISI